MVLRRAAPDAAFVGLASITQIRGRCLSLGERACYQGMCLSESAWSSNQPLWVVKALASTISLTLRARILPQPVASATGTDPEADVDVVA